MAEVKRPTLADDAAQKQTDALTQQTSTTVPMLVLLLGIAAGAASSWSLATTISEWYMDVLKHFPVATKSVTTGVVQFLGDLAAQICELSSKKRITKRIPSYNLRRGISLFFDGLLLSGPLLHYCFGVMEQILPTDGDGNAAATLFHVFVNDYVVDSIYITLSMVFTSVMEGYGWEEIRDIFRQDYWATLTASWCTSLGLIPVEFLCFGYLPVSLRVLAMNFVDLFWGAIISFFSHRSRRKQ